MWKESKQMTSTGETDTPNISISSEGRAQNRHRTNEDVESAQVKQSPISGLSEPRKITFGGQVKAVFGSWINILLICVPAGIVLNYALDDQRTHRIAVFVVGILFGKLSGLLVLTVLKINFLAIIPLAGILSYATEEIAMRIGETLGGLLNASFGNAVELIVTIIALAKDEVCHN